MNSAVRLDRSLDGWPIIFTRFPILRICGEIPDATIYYYLQPKPLLDSWWSFAEQCKALIDSKAYRLGGGS